MMQAARALATLMLAAACWRDPAPAVSGRPPSDVGGAIVRTSDLIAGPQRETVAIENPYAGDQIALAEGERLYGWFNCTGCHGGRGGGGIGPPLADADWIYGGRTENVFQSIVQGRPYGMPSFGGQIPDEQVWKIVAFVRSLSERTGSNGSGR